MPLATIEDDEPLKTPSGSAAEPAIDREVCIDYPWLDGVASGGLLDELLTAV